MLINVTQHGNFAKTQRFFADATTKFPNEVTRILHKYGQMGVETLRSTTPRDTGETAESWGYEVDGFKLIFTNSKIVGGIPLPILIHYGHATRNGGYVRGIDFINPSLQPIFDQIADDCMREVNNL